MLKKAISVVLSIALLNSCAYVSTKSTYEGVERIPAKVQYSKCLVRVGVYGFREHERGTISSSESSGKLGYFKSYLEGNTQFRLTCREIMYESFEITVPKELISEQSFREAIERREEKSELPVFGFYLLARPRHSPYDYWVLFYGVSLGFIPLVIPDESIFWFVKHEPNQLKSEAIKIENKQWNWFWTPLFLYPYSKKDPNAERDKVEKEALTKALNGN